MAKWIKFNSKDFARASNGNPYVISRMGTHGIRGLEPRVKKTFFPFKEIDDVILVPKDVFDRLKYHGEWKAEFPRVITSGRYPVSYEGMKAVESVENMFVTDGEDISDKLGLLGQAISDENEAIIMYQNMKEMFPEWSDVLQDIINEELKHIGQINELVKLISSNVCKNISEGENEAVDQMKSQITSEVIL